MHGAGCAACGDIYIYIYLEVHGSEEEIEKLRRYGVYAGRVEGMIAAAALSIKHTHRH